MIPQDILKLAISYYNGSNGIGQDYTKAMELFLQLSKDNSDAQTYIGRMYCFGEGVEQNYFEAVKWFKRAAKAGNADAMNRLGCRYMKGEGVCTNLKEAVRWFKLSAQHGHDKAEANLGSIYELGGDGVLKDIEKAVYFYKSAVSKGNNDAIKQLATLYFYGDEGVDVDYREALRLFLLIADKDAEVSNMVALMYYNGQGCDISNHEALKWFKISACLGSADSQIQLGCMYHNGNGCVKRRNFRSALKWYKMAADRGDMVAYFNLGIMYENGQGVDKDINKAIDFYTISAEGGLYVAQYRLACKYENGNNVEKDYAKALFWYTKAAEQGYSWAENNIGVMYISGKGVCKDSIEALRWYKRGIKHGCSVSHNNYAEIFEQGIGVDQSYGECIASYRESDGANNIQSLLKFANMLIFGWGVDRDYVKGVSILKKIYRSGFNIVCYNLGCAYFNGDGVQVNHSRAKFYWSKVAEYDSKSRYALNCMNISRKMEFSSSYFIGVKTDSYLYAEKKLAEQGVLDLVHSDVRAYLSKYGDISDATFKIWKNYCNSTRKEAYRHIYDSLFSKALKSKDPRALYLSAASGFTQDVLKINFTLPYYVDEIISTYFKVLNEAEQWAVIYILYFVSQGYDNLYKEPFDNLSNVIYEKSQNVLNDEEKYKRLEDVYKLCMIKNNVEFRDEYVEYLLDILEGSNLNTTIYPNDNVLSEIYDFILKANNIGEVIHTNGSVRLCLKLQNCTKTELVVNSETEYLISSLILGAYGLKNITVVYSSSIIDADTCVIFPRVRKEPGYHFDCERVQLVDIERCLVDYPSIKYAYVLVDKEFCTSVHTRFYDLRVKLFDKAVVSKVLEFPLDAFDDLESSMSMIFLDFTKCSHEVEFCVEGVNKIVSYDEIRQYNYVLSSFLYGQEIKAVKGEGVYIFDDLISINQNAVTNSMSTIMISNNNFTSSVTRVLSEKLPLPVYGPLGILKYKGPHIFLQYRDGVKLCINQSDEYCATEDNMYAIKVKENLVDPSFLAYKLLTDPDILSYFKNIIDKNNNFMPRDLLYKKVAIPKDLEEQRAIVKRYLDRHNDLLDIDYNVVIIAPLNLRQEIIEDLHRMRFNNDYYITDFSQYEIFVEDFKKSSLTESMIDAIILDTRSSIYEDVLADYSMFRERNVEMHLLAETQECTKLIGRKMIDYFKDGGRVFSYEKDLEKYFSQISNLVSSLRTSLDISSAPHSKIRNQYKEVFIAADAIDEKYSDMDVSRSIARYIMSGCILNTENVDGPSAKFRNICHKLLEKLVECNLLPRIAHRDKLQHGAIAKFLRDGQYKDNSNRRAEYVMIINPERIMDTSLARSIVYLCEITNAGVHGSMKSNKLGTAALHILMEFVLWFYQYDIVEDMFKGLKEGLFFTQTRDDRGFDVGLGVEYEVQVDMSSKDPYYYANNVHLQYKDGLKKGSLIKFKKCISLEIDKKIINGTYIVFYAKQDSYDVIK